jgi:hypothetical protein
MSSLTSPVRRPCPPKRTPKRERTQRYQRAQIRQHCGFRIFRVEDEPTFVACLSDRVSSPNPEDLKIAAYNHLRSQRIEPPPIHNF